MASVRTLDETLHPNFSMASPGILAGTICCDRYVCRYCKPSESKTRLVSRQCFTFGRRCGKSDAGRRPCLPCHSALGVCAPCLPDLARHAVFADADCAGMARIARAGIVHRHGPVENCFEPRDWDSPLLVMDGRRVSCSAVGACHWSSAARGEPRQRPSHAPWQPCFAHPQRHGILSSVWSSNRDSYEAQWTRNCCAHWTCGIGS